MYYTIYKVTNQINGKIYIGAHKTKNLDDGYMGSGKYLKRAVEKHGLENFSKEILFVFDTPEEMYAKEAELVNEDFLAEANTYNLKIGGFGGFDYLNYSNLNIYDNHTEIAKKNLEKSRDVLKKLRETPEWISSLSEKVSESLKLYYSDKEGSFKGHTHSDETKLKISEANSKSQLGERNSQYATMWIYNPVTKQNKKVKKDSAIPDGWQKGRKLKRVDG